MMLKIFMSILFQVNKFLENASPDAKTPLFGFKGEAKVSKTIVGPYQQGRVYFRGTSWPACCKECVTLKPGDTVQVIDINNITLIVEPLPCCVT